MTCSLSAPPHKCPPMDQLADLNVFMAIIRRRSFRHAAHELGVTTSALSHTMRNCACITPAVASHSQGCGN